MKGQRHMQAQLLESHFLSCCTAQVHTGNRVCAKKDDFNASNKNRSTDRVGGDDLCPNATRASLHSAFLMITLAEHTGAPIGLTTATGASDEQKSPLCTQETFCAARPVSLGLHSYQ